MYDNIGKKIKLAAKISFWLVTTASVVSGVAMMGDSYSAIIGILLVLIGPFIAWVSTWLLYGFGEIIDKLTEIEENTNCKHNETKVVTKVKEDADNKSFDLEKLRKKGVITEDEYEEFSNSKAVI